MFFSKVLQFQQRPGKRARGAEEETALEDMQEYTRLLENRCYDLEEEESDAGEDCEKVICFLNDAQSFLPFGGRLRRFLARRCGAEEQTVDAKFILRTCAKKDIPLNRTTVEGWMAGGPGPKKGKKGRELLFRLAFAFALPREQTVELFHKVYLDRAFNSRDPEEFLYACCLDAQLPWQHARALIAQLPALRPDADTGTGGEETLATGFLAAQTAAFRDDAAMLDYIRTHPHNFSLSSTAAKAARDKYLCRVRGNAQHTGVVDRELARFPYEREAYAGRKLDSIDVLLDVILDTRISRRKKGEGIAGTVLPREIRSCFPTLKSFAAEPTFETLRKLIILLFSYDIWFWAQEESGGRKLYIDQYKSQLDVILQEAGLAPLYYGDPYDWLFLYSAMHDRPLDCFREIMAEVTDSDCQ